MRSHPIALALAAVLALAGCATEPLAPLASADPTADLAPTPAFTETGEFDGAPYRIEVPENWQGDLVMYLTGYEAVGSPRDGATEQSAFDRLLLSQGYAVARSLYSAQGWAVVEALQDNERLRRHALANLPATRRTWLVGHSMGAHLALASIERHPDAYDGALALCGVNGPAPEMFSEGVLPPLVAFDHLFPGVLPQAPGGLADPGAPPWPDYEAIEKALAGDEARAGLLAARFQILRKDLAGALMIRYGVLHELAARAGGFPVDKRDYVFTGLGDDAAVNAGARRYAGSPVAMAWLRDSAPITGTTRKPVVVLSNLNDPTVPAPFSGRYAVLAAEAGNAANVTVMPSAGQGHCEFPEQDVVRALGQLTTPRP
jgi:pimeloyl-ACP methyl ester carboxylesterase